MLSGDKEAQKHALRDNAKYYTMVNDYIDSAPPEAHFAKAKPRAHGAYKEYSYYNEGRTCNHMADIFSEELCPKGRFAGKVTKGQSNYLSHPDEPTAVQYAFHPDILGGERVEDVGAAGGAASSTNRYTQSLHSHPTFSFFSPVRSVDLMEVCQ